MTFDIAVFAQVKGRVNARAALKQATETMHLIINGENHDDLPDGLTISRLVEYLGLPEKKIAIERNHVVVPKSTFAEVELKNHDVLEIIHFIGGG